MKRINSLLPENGIGYNFVVYADSCSGIEGKLHAINLSKINEVAKSLMPEPEFVCFPGDEIIGLTNDKEKLIKQWDYWLNTEMAWLKEKNIQLFNTTGNHTTYNDLSENVFREVFSYHPQNGPENQKELSYFIKKENLLMVFVNTMWSGLGGEGRIETEWLDRVLTENEQTKLKLVFGHHPVFAANGFSGDFQRNIEPVSGARFWQVLVKHNVQAYFCSHILAFDVQVHDGVLQIMTAGAGTADRMPEGIEYLHLVQAAIDENGIRYQVLDTDGQMREWLKWPLPYIQANEWNYSFENSIRIRNKIQSKIGSHTLLVWRITGLTSNESTSLQQTLVCGWKSEKVLPVVWIGLAGPEQRVTVYIHPQAVSSPHHWYGPTIPAASKFEIDIAIHNGMGPGGILWRWNKKNPWSSLKASSPWGAEIINIPKQWDTGNSKMNYDNKAEFKGDNLRVSYAIRNINFPRRR